VVVVVVGCGGGEGSSPCRRAEVGEGEAGPGGSRGATRQQSSRVVDVEGRPPATRPSRHPPPSSPVGAEDNMEDWIRKLSCTGL